MFHEDSWQKECYSIFLRGMSFVKKSVFTVFYEKSVYSSKSVFSRGIIFAKMSVFTVFKKNCIFIIFSQVRIRFTRLSLHRIRYRYLRIFL